MALDISTEEVEDLALEVDSLLGKFEKAGLREISSLLGLDPSSYELELSKLKLMKNIRRFLEQSSEQFEVEGQYEFFRKVLNCISEVMDKMPSTPVAALTTAPAVSSLPPQVSQSEEGAEAAADPVVGTGRKEGLAELSSRSTLSRFAFDHLKREAKIQNNSNFFRNLPNPSNCFQMYPDLSECVRTCPKASKNS